MEGGGLAVDEARDGELVVQPHPLPPSATRTGPVAGEGSVTDPGTGLEIGEGTGPAARSSGSGGCWGEGAARRREGRREEAASEAWIKSTRGNLTKLCEVASKPFWQVCWACRESYEYVGRSRGGGRDKLYEVPPL